MLNLVISLQFSLPVAPEIQENHENHWETMENHQKQRKMKKKRSCKWKKNENLDSKLQILTPNLEIFKNSRKFSFFYDCFIMFFWFSLPVAPEIQETHANQWKTMECHQKPRKLKKKQIWTQSCRFSLQTRKSSKTRGNFHFFMIVLSWFFDFPCPWHLKSRKTMHINENQ